MNRLKEKIIHRFNASSQTYNHAADIQFVAAKKLATYFPAHATSILEIGCGTGLLSQYVLERYPTSTFFLTDISPSMCHTAKQRFKKYPHIQTQCVDGENLNAIEYPSFDLIVSGMVLHWFHNLETGFEKIVERLNKRGQFVFSFLGEESLLEWKSFSESHGLPSGVLKFPSIRELEKFTPFLELSTIHYRQYYSSLYSFLKTLKKIGGSVTNQAQASLAPQELVKLLTKAPMPFYVTYQIIYGIYKK